MPTMTRFHFVRAAAAILLAGGLAGCVDLSSPDEGTDEADLTFVRISSGVELERDSISFWAVPGETRQVEIRYASSDVYLNGNTKCLLFRVPAGSLLRHPDGRRVQPGDSVRISIVVSDARQYRFRFAPAGLRFDPARPAELEIRYRWADADFNGDGVVDARDAFTAETISVWHQPSPSGRWFEIPTTRIADGVEARSTVFGFSQYALATDRGARPPDNAR